jgi:hypothetical protein
MKHSARNAASSANMKIFVSDEVLRVMTFLLEHDVVGTAPE